MTTICFIGRSTSAKPSAEPPRGALDLFLEFRFGGLQERCLHPAYAGRIKNDENRALQSSLRCGDHPRYLGKLDHNCDRVCGFPLDGREGVLPDQDRSLRAGILCGSELTADRRVRQSGWSDDRNAEGRAPSRRSGSGKALGPERLYQWLAPFYSAPVVPFYSGLDNTASPVAAQGDQASRRGPPCSRAFS